MSDFYEDLANWVNAICDERERARRSAEDTLRCESDIERLHREVSSIQTVAAKRPRTVRQIRELSRQIRQRELEIAFSSRGSRRRAESGSGYSTPAPMTTIGTPRSSIHPPYDGEDYRCEIRSCNKRLTGKDDFKE